MSSLQYIPSNPDMPVEGWLEEIFDRRGLAVELLGET